MLIKTVENFDIHLNLLDEHISVADSLPDETQKQLKGIYRRIENGTLLYFCAEVKAFKNGIELSSDYLGECFYKSEKDFIKNSGHFDDMVETVIKEAKEAINNLCSEDA